MLITKCAEPNETWSKVSIRIYGRTNSFTTASQKAEQATILSSIGSDSSSEEEITNQKRISKIPIRYRQSMIHSSEEESEDLCKTKLSQQEESPTVLHNISNRPLYSLPKPPTEISPKSCIPETNLEDVENNVETLSSSFFSGTETKSAISQESQLPAHLSSANIESVLQKILKHLAEIKIENRQLKKEFKKLRDKVEMKLAASNSAEVAAALSGITDAEEFPNLPLNNSTDLQNLETEITKDPSKANALARYLCRGGGYSNANSLVLLIIKRLLGRSIALLYSVEGRQDKLRFSDLNLLNVVIASVKMKYEDTENIEIIRRIGRVLAGAIDWDGNRVSRKRKRLELKEIE